MPRKTLIETVYDSEIRSVENRIAKEKKESNAARERTKLAEKVIDSLKDQLERQQHQKKIPVASGKPAKGSFVRLIIPDTHGAHVDLVAVGTMLGDIQHLKPKEIVWLGDHLDCGGFLAQHHTMGFVAETEIGFAEDVAAANQLLDQVAQSVGKVRQDYLEGNHEVRIERWCVTEALRKTKDAKFLLDRMGPEAVLHLKSRGIDYRKESETYDGLSVKGTIKRGECHFTHGVAHGVNAARAHLGAFGGNIVFGHVHREQTFSGETVAAAQMRAWCPGCLCKRRPYWHHTRPSGWTHGYAIQFVRNEGFLHLNVPIIDGKSYLVELTERLL